MSTRIRHVKLAPTILPRGTPATWRTALIQRATAPPVILATIVLFTFLVYARMLSHWFIADDFWFLRSAQVTPFWEYTVEAFDFRDKAPVSEFGSYRPLYLLAFRATYSLFGLNAFGYHALNVAIHLGAVVIVWLVVRRLTERVWTAHLAALIFGIHPAYVEAVDWVVNGNTLMATFAYLLTFLLFINWAHAGPRRPLYYVGYLLAFVAALLLHPATMTLAVVLPAYYVARAGPSRLLERRSWVQFLPLAVITAAYGVLQNWVRADRGHDEVFQSGWHMFGNYVDYLGMALYPVLPESASWPVFAAAMLVVTAFLLTRSRRPPYLPLLAAWWFYISLVPDSTFTWGTYGRLLYLPGASLSLFLAVAVVEGMAALPKGFAYRARHLAPFAVALLVIPAVVLVLQHENIVGDESSRSRQFIEELRDTYDIWPAPEGTLYVVNAPLNLRLFSDDALKNAVRLYYGDVHVRSLSAKQESALRLSLAPRDEIFHYYPQSAQ